MQITRLLAALFPDHPRVNTWTTAVESREIVDGCFIKREGGNGVEHGIRVTFPNVRGGKSFALVAPWGSFSATITFAAGVRKYMVEGLHRTATIETSAEDFYVSWGGTAYSDKHSRLGIASYRPDSWRDFRWKREFGRLTVALEEPQHPSMFWWYPKPKAAEPSNDAAA